MEGRSTKDSFSPSILLLLLLFWIIEMAEKTTATASPSDSNSEVHIVYMERPPNVDPEAHDIQFLSSVLGSEEAAKEALLYSYKTAASGFSAKLTPKQVEEIGKKEGVLHVAPNQKYTLHSGSATQTFCKTSKNQLGYRTGI